MYCSFIPLLVHSHHAAEDLKPISLFVARSVLMSDFISPYRLTLGLIKGNYILSNLPTRLTECFLHHA